VINKADVVKEKDGSPRVVGRPSLILGVYLPALAGKKLPVLCLSQAQCPLAMAVFQEFVSICLGHVNACYFLFVSFAVPLIKRAVQSFSSCDISLFFLVVKCCESSS
jgi:hypothetical protein